MPFLFLLFLALPIAVAVLCDAATFAMLMVPYLAIALVKLSSLNNLDHFLDEQTGGEQRSTNQPSKASERRALNAARNTSDLATS